MSFAIQINILLRNFTKLSSRSDSSQRTPRTRTDNISAHYAKGVLWHEQSSDQVDELAEGDQSVQIEYL